MTNPAVLDSSTPNVPYTRGQTIRRVLLNAYTAVVGAYGLNISLLLVLRAAVGEGWNLIGLMNSYLHLLILPAVILLPLSMVLRRKWLVIELAAPFLFFFSVYGVQFVPRMVTVSNDTARITVLSFNINKSNRAVDEVIAIIRSSDADVVAIQELSPWMAQAFDAQLAEMYPYKTLHPQMNYSGQGILSRFPLSDDAYWQIHLGHQRATLDWNGQPLAFYNVHPVHPLRGIQFDGAPRTEEINDLLSRTATVSQPVLIAGDFNMTNLSDDYARVTNRFQDTYQAVGWGMGFGFPDFANAFGIANLPPVARIDYIFHDAHFQSVEMRVLPTSGGSDHFPLLATLAWIR